MKQIIGLIVLLTIGILRIDTARAENIENIFCPALKDDRLYEEYKYRSYKKLIPGRDGWIFRTGNDFEKDMKISDRGMEYLKEVNEAFENKGIELVILMTPTRGMVHHDKIYPEDQEKYGISDVDSLWNDYKDSIKDMNYAGLNVIGIDKPEPGTDFFYKRDHHWNTHGAKIAAVAVADFIKQIDAYKDIPKIEYVTQTKGEHEFDGMSKKVFRRICDTNQPPEMIDVMETVKVKEAKSSDALFGETQLPEIVLIGTSNSTLLPSYANFEGFLKEALSADILNISISGGGIDTAMVAYLNSDSYKKRPAKIAIWEIPGYYKIEDYDHFFREATAAVYGSCKENALAYAENIPLDRKISLVLDDMEKKEISGSDYYVRLEFDKPVAQEFRVDLRYIKNRDQVKFKRENRHHHDNIFTLSLDKNKTEPLEKVVLHLPSDFKPAKVNAMICKKDVSEDEFFAGFWSFGEQIDEMGVKSALDKIRKFISFR